ncbi:MAG: class I SAM-dependent methyltransferase [Botrimarina sp.]
MLPLHRLAPLIVRQNLSRQTLGRTPEPVAETNEADHVEQYNRVGETRLMVSYAVGLELIDRVVGGRRELAYDFASGPGRFTAMLHTHLGFDRVVGIDLAPNMVQRATENSTAAGLSDRVVFQRGDITNPDGLPDGSADLCCFADAAHHLSDLDAVSTTLCAMERVTRSDGVVVLMDLVRLKTAAITREYVELVGSDYIELGLPAFKQDFRDSMYAAWTAQELQQAVPRSTSKAWFQIVSFAMPCVQFICGVPVERRALLGKGASRISKSSDIAPRHMWNEWQLLRQLLFRSRSRRIA